VLPPTVPLAGESSTLAISSVGCTASDAAVTVFANTNGSVWASACCTLYAHWFRNTPNPALTTVRPDPPGDHTTLTRGAKRKRLGLIRPRVQPASADVV